MGLLVKRFDQVRHCWQELGFLSLVGHGIPVEDLQTLKQSTLAFLNGMSVAEKLQLNEQWSDAKKAMDPSHAAIFRGYSPPNIENVALNQGRRGLSPDDCEKFTWALSPTHRSLLQQNLSTMRPESFSTVLQIRTFTPKIIQTS